MRFIRFSNGVTINVEHISSVSRPVKKDPYNKTYGAVYDVTLISGEVHSFYDFIKSDPRLNPPTYGHAIFPYGEMMNILKPFPDMYNGGT